jgi:heme-degrading monooxygenase HmoA
LIVRVLTARVPPQHVGAFNEKLRGLLTELRRQDGLVYAKLARRLDERDAEEVVLFEEWRTPADLWQWTGGQLSRPRLLPGTEDLIGDLVISHYEALDVDPSELGLTTIAAHTRDEATLAVEKAVHDRPTEATGAG